MAEREEPCSNSKPKAATAARAFARPRGASERSELGASKIQPSHLPLSAFAAQSLDAATPAPADRRFGLAEGVGFEPTRRSPACRFSRPVPSTTRPSLRGARPVLAGEAAAAQPGPAGFHHAARVPALPIRRACGHGRDHRAVSCWPRRQHGGRRYRSRIWTGASRRAFRRGSGHSPWRWRHPAHGRNCPR